MQNGKNVTDWNVLINNVYLEMKRVIEVEEITTENILGVAVMGIPIVQRLFKGNKPRGPFKKKILLAVMKILVEDMVKKPVDQAMLTIVIDTVVSQGVDMLIRVAPRVIKHGGGSGDYENYGCCLMS